jgi:hypothetical protein
MSKPALSLILCSRNDQYMGNSRWRLQTSLNYLAENVHVLGREEDVEVLVTDWGSDTPLREVLELSPVATRIVSFIQVPPEIARDLQKDSPFAEVFALNAAARRAGGEYIGRIDQDTLVGKRFLEYFFDLYEGRQQLEVPLASVLLFANQRMVPYRLMVQCPSLWAVEEYISLFGRLFKIEITPRTKYYNHGVGIWLVHRDLWIESGGYDERLIYMNAMEINMIGRLMKKYDLVNLGQLVNYDLYHIEHYHPLVIRSSSTHRKGNPEHLFANTDILNPNGPDWGLVNYSFRKLPSSRALNEEGASTINRSFFEHLSFLPLVLFSSLQMALDELIKPLTKGCMVWKHRIGLVSETVRGQSLLKWPQLLARLWVSKRREHRQRKLNTLH